MITLTRHVIKEGLLYRILGVFVNNAPYYLNKTCYCAHLYIMHEAVEQKIVCFNSKETKSFNYLLNGSNVSVMHSKVFIYTQILLCNFSKSIEIFFI